MNHDWIERMNHDWKKVRVDVASGTQYECRRCSIYKNNWFYQNIPGFQSGMVISIERMQEPDCDSMIVQRVLKE